MNRKNKMDLAGIMLIGACLGVMLAIGFACYQTDKANGISVSQSLAANGL